MNENAPLLCIDIGNTTCRGAVWSDGKFIQQKVIRTNDFFTSADKWLSGWLHKGNLCYCSVVPKAEKILHQALKFTEFGNSFSLDAENQSFLPISYPIPSEIGADRIANSYATFKRYPLPAVVIDLGTATTFDVILKKQGYVGGVIVPGPQGMLDYLGNRTALLPNVNVPRKIQEGSAIGESTQQAMISGLSHGYLPMLKGILRSISNDIELRGEKIASTIQTGGESKNFLLEGAIVNHTLTLEGLALAWHDKHSQT